MTKDLEALVEKTKRIEMSPKQETEQRRSFVYGNTQIENERITKELVEKVDLEISKKR